MPKSKQRKGFKEKQHKKRQLLEKSRDDKQKVMQQRMDAMITKIREDYAKQLTEPNVSIEELSNNEELKKLNY